MRVKPSSHDQRQRTIVDTHMESTGTGSVRLDSIVTGNLWLSEQLSMLLKIHNKIRDDLNIDTPGEAHVVNENLVVRVAAAMEAVGMKDRAKTIVATEDDWPRICYETLIFMRNLIVHEPCGCLDSRRVPKGHQSTFDSGKRFYTKFCERYPEAKVDKNERLRLPADTVLTPLVNGCIEFARR